MAGDGEVTNGEIVRRLDELRLDVREMGGSFVRTSTFEDWRRESYGRRVGEVEKDNAETKAAFEAFKLETDRRYRTTVNLFIGGGITLFGGAFLLVLQLVAK